MRGSRNFRQAGGRGGGGLGGGSRPDGQKTVWTMFFLVINLFYSLHSGSNGFITEGRRGSNFFQGVGVSKETHITCDFPGGGGGSGPPNPPLDPHVGWPDATVCLQNHGLSKSKKTEKYHPTTTKRKKSYLLLVEIASADPEVVRGSGPPGKSQVIWVSIGYKQLDPLENVGPPPPWKMLVGPPLEP